MPDRECDEAFERLESRLEALKRKPESEADKLLLRELEVGKMLGVLIASDSSGARHTLYAFSGQIGNAGFSYPGFVEPVFDYLDPTGYFKTHEAEISLQNRVIEEYERGVLSKAADAFLSAKTEVDTIIKSRKEEYRKSKANRAAKRAAGCTDETELANMIRQSQFEKAELNRLRKKLTLGLEPLATELTKARERLAAMKDKRHNDSEKLQKWLFTNFKLLNARGDIRSVAEIFADTPAGTAPSGAGECCAPKLLESAYRRGLTPLTMAEYWFGKPKDGEVRIHGKHYPACRGKCLPLLRWMLQGLVIDPPLDSGRHLPHAPEPQIIYENSWFCVVDKPAGMLSVPGRTVELSLAQWLSAHYGPGRDVMLAHRLDQDTSGLLLAAFGQRAYKILQSLFACRKVNKTYIADLEGDYLAASLSRSGRVELPLSPDYLDRPRQLVDANGGKEAVTDYEFIDVRDGKSRVIFHPHTGRTHQLRVHAASPLGLGMPIVGDPIYGKGGTEIARMHLHAQRLRFRFPIDGREYEFESPLPF